MSDDNGQQVPALEQDDEALLKRLQELLSQRAVGNPYDADGVFAANLCKLPVGLRAMGATHWLDVSLTLDSITWHFGNFGEPGLVRETESGLRELELVALADVFREAEELMLPLLAGRTDENGDPYQILEAKGLSQRVEEIDRRAWALSRTEGANSPIYDAWVRYARKYPERVFGDR